MFPIAVIFFREVLEITLIIGVVMAATRDLVGRNFWVITGIISGILGSIAISLSINQIIDSFEGEGEEIFKAAIMLIASIMVAWTVIWMKVHSKEIMSKAESIGKSATEGRVPLYTLAIIIATSMLREGTEIILFTYGSVISNKINISEVMMGGLIGAGGAMFVATLIYLGLLKVSKKYFFIVTTWLLILFASAMASEFANSLASLGVIPSFASPLWDSSWLLSEDSIIGKTLHVILGYTSKPSGIQIIFYLTTLTVITLCLKYVDKYKRIKSVEVK
jgi:high-affinity iron transporter